MGGSRFSRIESATAADTLIVQSMPAAALARAPPTQLNLGSSRMITLSFDRSLIRLSSWDELYETPGYVKVLDAKSVQLREIIGVYSFQTREACGLKNCKQPHGNGYVVTTTSGSVTNIGSICGKRAFSITFTNLRRAFDRDLKAKERRERLEALQSRLPAVLEQFRSMRDHAKPLYRATMGLRGSGVPRQIADAVRNMMRIGDGAITKNRKATPQEREFAIESGLARRDMPYYVSEIVGRISSVSALNEAETLRELLNELDPTLNRLAECDLSTISDKEARHLDKATSGIDSRLDQIGRTIMSLRAFATQDNIGQLAMILDSPTDRRLFDGFLHSLRAPGLVR